jgi:hypothetical protein
MASRLAARLCRLEARNPEPNPLEELTGSQARALLLYLNSLREGAVSDETLWHAGMSREAYEAALNSISQETWKRLVARWEKKAVGKPKPSRKRSEPSPIRSHLAPKPSAVLSRRRSLKTYSTSHRVDG